VRFFYHKERHFILKTIGLVAGILVLLLVLSSIWLYQQLRASLPVLDGQVDLAGLLKPVNIHRDELGIPTIHGVTRQDVAQATGFLHAQDRFFQMDILRRSAAGELAQIFGKAALAADRKVRMHRFRSLARKALGNLPGNHRQLLTAYTAGVNSGLAALKGRPVEYVMLNDKPMPWLPEDTLLVLYAMYLDLQGKQAERESAYALVHDLLPKPLAQFLTPLGTEWDAPLEGPPLTTPPIPKPQVFSLRDQVGSLASKTRAKAWQENAGNFFPGSNNWAVAGQHTHHGSALLANDMHLGLRVPNIWYRAVFVFPDQAGGERRVAGVTLPGAPAIVAGSNGDIAWGFTNSYGDWADLVLLEFTTPDRYITPYGPQSVHYYRETIQVKNGSAQILEVPWTIWGPVMDQDHRGRQRALRWVAHDLEGVNLKLIDLENATTVEEAITVANQVGAPAQNFLVASKKGRIGWTIFGPIPTRFGHDGRLPESWADGQRGWDGWLAPADYPRIIDPPSGRLWTANARVLSPNNPVQLGDGGYALGARAQQIRDHLTTLKNITEADLLALQLDDRALFLKRWRDVLLAVLTPQAVAADTRRQTLRTLVKNWRGQASIESVGFRMVRAFRLMLDERVFSRLTAACKQADVRFTYTHLRQREGPLWRLVSERPQHLLDPRYKDWQALLLDVVDEVIEHFTQDGANLEEHTWGAHNKVHVRHPLSAALPLLGYWLDIPPVSLPGDYHMPRLQTPTEGASERMVVAPGQEAKGVLHMPVGQSGHPLSPFFDKGHKDWENGAHSPFISGRMQHRLRLEPTQE
jgi:penicillin amidase